MAGSPINEAYHRQNPAAAHHELGDLETAHRPAIDARLGLARAYWVGGDHGEARAQARRALRQAGNAHLDALRNQALGMLRDMDGRKARAGR